MSLVNPMMQFLVTALEDVTLVDFTLARTTLARDLARLRHVKPKATMDALNEDANASVTLMMLWINRDVLYSLVRHTLAYDFSKRPSNSGHPPSSKTFNPRHRGTYATSIAIKGRDGRFLIKVEIRTLIARLRAYVRAADYLPGINFWPNPAVRNAHTQKIEEIDCWYRRGAASPGNPRFLESARAITNTKLLIATLERYASFPGPGIEPLRQSPIMVGCTSKTIEERTKAHLPGSGLSNTTATWALTLCAIRSMGLIPEVVVVPIVVTESNDELLLSERLVTTLVQSFVEQDGFNIIEAGGQGDASHPGVTDACLANFYVSAPWVNNQLETALTEMARRSRIMGFCTAIEQQPLILEDLEDRARAAGPGFGGIIRETCQFFKLEDEEHEFLADAVKATRFARRAREEDDSLFQLLGVWTREIETLSTQGDVQMEDVD